MNIVPKIFVPTDDLGYTESFDLDHLENAKNFFDEFGFVVVNGILTQDEINASLEEIYHILGADGTGFDINDPDSWSKWPTNSIEHFGNISKPPIFTRQFILNRTNIHIQNVCSYIIGDNDLLINHDRACFYRPTQTINFSDGTRNQKWETKPNLHLDMNPWNYINNNEFCNIELGKLKYENTSNFIAENNYNLKKDGIALQGSINFFDNKEEDGGFILVPGFFKYFDEYFANIPQKK
jgi:hypothetical protein